MHLIKASDSESTVEERGLRIAFLTAEFVTEKKFDGGLANYLNRVTRALASAGHAPEIFVISDRDETIDHGGIPVHRVSHAFTWLGRLAYRGFRKVFRTDLLMTTEVLRASRALARRLVARHRQESFDLVQASDFYATGLFVPRIAGFPLITRLSYYAPAWRKAYEVRRTRDRWLMEQLEARMLRRSHFRYAPSSAIAELVRAELKLDVDVCHPPAFVDTPPSQEDFSVYRDQLAGKSYVLFFGRVCRLKGVYTLADAMAMVLAENPEPNLVIAGREDPDGIINELRGRLGGMANRLIHLTRMPHAQLFPIIRHAATTVLPSRIDNSPNTCIEAMALGKTVIATRATGFDDLIMDGRNGFLVAKDDAVALAQAIRSVLARTQQDRDEIGRRAALRVEDFSAARVIPDLVQYYRRCISSLATPSRCATAAIEAPR
jgi:glycosyltransferase involved in cell wall biosynthesis